MSKMKKKKKRKRKLITANSSDVLETLIGETLIFARANIYIAQNRIRHSSVVI